MATSLSKLLTKSKAHSHVCSTSTTIPTSHSLQRQFWLRRFSAVADSPSPPKVSDNKRESRWSRLLLFLPGAITFGLGSWQIVRREEKIKTLEYQQQRLKMEPMKLNTEHPPDEKNLDALEFRRVSCKGVFDEQKSIYLGPRSRSISGVTENGFYVITPLMPIPGGLDSMQSPILVNRGWVPRSWRDKPPKSTEADFVANESTEAKPVSHEQSSWWKFWSKMPVITKDVPTVKPVEVVGVIRRGENPSIFVPANDPSTGRWFYVDVPAMARAIGLPEDTIYVEDVHEDIDRSRPYPVPRDINTLIRSKVMPQDHLNYTITWYSLSAAVTFMAYKRLKPKSARR